MHSMMKIVEANKMQNVQNKTNWFVSPGKAGLTFFFAMFMVNLSLRRRMNVISETQIFELHFIFLCFVDEEVYKNKTNYKLWNKQFLTDRYESLLFEGLKTRQNGKNTKKTKANKLKLSNPWSKPELIELKSWVNCDFHRSAQGWCDPRWVHQIACWVWVLSYLTASPKTLKNWKTCLNFLYWKFL